METLGNGDKSRRLYFVDAEKTYLIFPDFLSESPFITLTFPKWG
jgi:hypothetical protein